jgi:MFS transporter, ACS family, hexuronate transporter
MPKGSRMRPSRFRWFIIFLLFAISVVNYIDRAAISYSIPQIERDLGLSPADAGGILGAFGLGYAITTLLGGIVVDRFGSRVVLAVAAVLWSVSIGATGLATGFVMLYAARVLLGVSEGPNFPALTGAVSRWLAPQERATALGNALVAVPLALAIGGPIVTQLLAWFDWRGTFFILFGLSILWVPLWLIFYRDDPRQSRFVNKAELAHIEAAGAAQQSANHHSQSGKDEDAVRFLLTSPTLLANYWAYFVYGYFLFFFMTWLPSYLAQVYGLKLVDVGLFTVLPWLAAALVLWMLGRVSDHLLRTTGSLRTARSYLIAATQCIAAIAVIPLALTNTFATAITCITIAVAASMGANAVYFAVNVDVAPKRAATAFGIMNLAFAISGFLAPVITGSVLKLHGSFVDAFWLMVALAFSSVLVVLVFHHPDRDRAKQMPVT